MTGNTRTNLLGAMFTAFLLLNSNHCCGCHIKKLKADCSGLNLTEIPQNLDSRIISLDLSHNNLDDLKNNSFENYTRLNQLLIDHNQLSVLEEGAFNGLKRLLKLSLNGNKLDLQTSYPKPVFRPLLKLDALDIRNNVFMTNNSRDCTYYPYFGHLTNLNALYMDLVSIPCFSQSGFTQTRKLTVLRFVNCKLLNMKNDTFKGIAKSVKFVFFKSCRHIKNVELGFLSAFPNLESISLHHSYIHLSRALSLLHPCRNKTMKSISFNRVTSENQDSAIYPYAVTVTKEMMKYLQTICVENLVLSENGIVDFEPGSLLSYNHPECFKSIVFTGNRFSVLSPVKRNELGILFIKLINLEFFDFSFIPLKYTDITYVNRKAMPFDIHRTKEEEFQLKTNEDSEKDVLFERTDIENIKLATTSLWTPPKLTTLRISHFLDLVNGHESFIIKNASNLRYLDVSYLQVTLIPDIFLDGPNNIEYLDASGIDSTLYCEKSTIPLFHNATTVSLQSAKLDLALFKNNIFRLIPSVRNLDISWNNLWFIHDDAFLRNRNIQKLTLKANSFQEIPVVIMTLLNLEYLDISYNNIQYINETLRTWFDQQQRIKQKFVLKLWGNILKCNCQTTDFIEWLFKTKVKFEKSPKLICFLENGTKTDTRKVYEHFHELFRHCNSEIWLRVGIGCLIGFVVLITPTAILFNFRWQIAYLIYRRFKRVIENNIKEKFKYDMYVCYVEESTNWIKDILVPKIENTWKMSLCITERDILAGEMRSDAIAEAISQSRHVLIIISEGFKDGVWTSYELDRIKYEKYSKQLQKIIIITRNSSVENVPTELDNIWNDATILNWSDVDEESGWDKLRLNLFSEAF